MIPRKGFLMKCLEKITGAIQRLLLLYSLLAMAFCAGMFVLYLLSGSYFSALLVLAGVCVFVYLNKSL